MIQDDTQLYVTGVLYDQSAFPSDPQPMFDEIDSAFRTLTNLDYDYLCINRSENRFANSTTREQLLIFMKGITYNSNVYLSSSDSDSLRNAIIAVLNSLPSITYTDVEIRTTRTVI